MDFTSWAVGLPTCELIIRTRIMHDPTRRDILAAGAVPTALATIPALFAQQAGQGGTGGRFYEKGPVRIAYQETEKDNDDDERND